eukprot:3495078-Prorocentrum_lima.AAC.1
MQFSIRDHVSYGHTGPIVEQAEPHLQIEHARLEMEGSGSTPQDFFLHTFGREYQGAAPSHPM